MQPVNNVLLIDDDYIFNLINKKFIQNAKFSLKVATCTDATDALNYLRELVKTDKARFPDVIFIDMNMPGINCWIFLDRLAKFPEAFIKKCKVFALTSLVEEEDIEKAKSYKLMCDMVTKPLTMDKLDTLFSATLCA